MKKLILALAAMSLIAVTSVYAGECKKGSGTDKIASCVCKDMKSCNKDKACCPKEDKPCSEKDAKPAPSTEKKN